MQKKGDTVISQPIKGTSRKDADPAVDRELQQQLLHSAKERAENVMVVDLVRNDLSHTAMKGTVKVTELFGIYSFAQVHHMISTISAKVSPQVPFTEILRTAFPMGSMTGAPKIRVMQLIEMYEQTRRGLYSGAVGYITPTGDFDFADIAQLLNALAGPISEAVEADPPETPGYLRRLVGAAED